MRRSVLLRAADAALMGSLPAPYAPGGGRLAARGLV